MKLPVDKIYHLLGGFAVSIIGIVIAVAMGISPVVGFLLGVFAGIVKELWDEHKYGGGDFFDFFMTTLGALAGLFAYGFALTFT